MNQLDEFLTRRVRKAGTRNTYKTYLTLFFKSIKKQPENYIDKNIDLYENGKRREALQQYVDDLYLFAKNIEDKAPKSQALAFSTVKTYFRYHGLDIKSNTWDDLKSRNNLSNPRAVTSKSTPTKVQLSYLLSTTGTKQKAFILFTASSGMRISEVIRLEFSDVDFESRTIHIRKNIAKGGYERYTFFTEEAKKWVQRWIKEERETFLIHCYEISPFIRKMFEKKGIYGQFDKNAKKYVPLRKDGCQVSWEEMFKDDKRVFPLSDSAGRKLWYNLLEDAGQPFNEKSNDETQTDRYLMNYHSLRRFFHTACEVARIDERYENYMIGHTDSLTNLRRAYNDDNQFREAVRKAYNEKLEQELTILSDAAKVKSELEPRLNDQQNFITKLRNENALLKDKINDLEMNYRTMISEAARQESIAGSERAESQYQQKRIDELEEKVKLLLYAMKKNKDYDID